MKRALFLFTFVGLAASASLFAASTSATFPVSANVVANCTVSATNLSFGSYDPVTTNAATGSDAYANASLTVACTRNAANVWIGLDAGSNGASAVGTTRAMSAGSGNFLNYELYTANPNPAPGAAWGNTALTGKSYIPTSSAPAALTVYGREPKGQDAAVGSYTDTITATINY